MFFTDWSNTEPKVGRAKLDGSEMKVLFGKERVGWPNGIAVDILSSRIFFVDAKRDFVACSTFEGKRFVRLLVREARYSH